MTWLSIIRADGGFWVHNMVNRPYFSFFGNSSRKTIPTLDFSAYQCWGYQIREKIGKKGKQFRFIRILNKKLSSFGHFRIWFRHWTVSSQYFPTVRIWFNINMKMDTCQQISEPVCPGPSVSRRAHPIDTCKKSYKTETIDEIFFWFRVELSLI